MLRSLVLVPSWLKLQSRMVTPLFYLMAILSYENYQILLFTLVQGPHLVPTQLIPEQWVWATRITAISIAGLGFKNMKFCLRRISSIYCLVLIGHLRPYIRRYTRFDLKIVKNVAKFTDCPDLDGVASDEENCILLKQVSSSYNRLIPPSQANSNFQSNWRRHLSVIKVYKTCI